LWRIPHSADVRAEADKVIDYIRAVFIAFMDFAGDFIWKYCRRD
jgi:hypothetical protein